MARRVLQRVLLTQRHHRAFGPAGHRAAHMGDGRGPTASRQDEFGQSGQRGIVLGQGLVKRQHRFLLEQLKTGNRQFAAQVEKLVLHLDQHVTHGWGHVFAQQHADVGVQFIHVAHRVNPQRVFGYAGVVPQAGGAVVPGAGGDLRESVGHAGVSWKMKK